MEIPKGVYGGAPCGVPFWVGVGLKGGNCFVPQLLDKEDVGVVSLEDRVDASVAPLCIDGSDFNMLYCHV
jgi:hypothetical protein